MILSLLSIDSHGGKQYSPGYMFLFWHKESVLTILIDLDCSVVECYFLIIDSISANVK